MKNAYCDLGVDSIKNMGEKTADKVFIVICEKKIIV